jgi:BMFP domain-containing protein YqiC
MTEENNLENLASQLGEAAKDLVNETKDHFAEAFVKGKATKEFSKLDLEKIEGNIMKKMAAETDKDFAKWCEQNDIELAKEQAKEDNYDFLNTRVHTDVGLVFHQVIMVDANKLYQEIIAAQEEVLCSPLRFTGVSIEKIKQIFSNYGVDTTSKF